MSDVELNQVLAYLQKLKIVDSIVEDGEPAYILTEEAKHVIEKWRNSPKISVKKDPNEKNVGVALMVILEFSKRYSSACETKETLVKLIPILKIIMQNENLIFSKIEEAKSNE